MSGIKFSFKVGDIVYIRIGHHIESKFEAVYQVSVTNKLINYMNECALKILDSRPYFYFRNNNLEGYIQGKYSGNLDLPNVAWGFCDVTITNKVSHKITVIEGNINPYKLMAKNSLIPIDQSDCDTICAYSNKFEVTIIRNPAFLDGKAVYHDFEKPIDREFYQACFGDKIAKLSVDNNKI